MIQLSSFLGLIFDLDGVLWLSSPCHEEAFRETLSTYFLREFSYSELAGKKTVFAIRELFESSGILISDAKVVELAAQKTALAHDLLRVRKPLVADMARILKLLHESHKIALVTGSSRVNVELFVELINGTEIFDAIVSGDDISRGKPAPDGFLRGAKLLNLVPEQCVVVEDSISGIESACAAGMKIIAVRGGTEGDDVLIKAGAEYIVDDIGELLCNGQTV